MDAPPINFNVTEGNDSSTLYRIRDVLDGDHLKGTIFQEVIILK